MARLVAGPRRWRFWEAMAPGGRGSAVRRGAAMGRPPGSVKVRAAHEIVAARTLEFAFLVLQFVAAPRTPEPMFAQDMFLVFAPGIPWNLRFR